MPLIEARGLVKSFGGVHALAGIDLTIEAGEVHAICGENGAGKSTLNRILSGNLAQDEGEVRFEGSVTQWRSVADAEAAGVAIVHQEPTVFPDLDAADNIGLMRERTRFSGLWLDRARALREAREILAELGEDFDAAVPLEALSPAQRQMVSIARAISRECRLLILDEPTSSLSAPESEALFRVVGRLRSRGVAILYVSHRLEEIAQIADRVTVLRDGQTVWTKLIAEASNEAIVRAMVGREVLVPGPRATPIGGVVLEVRNLRSNASFRDVSFTIRSGEILGLAGLVGSGRSEIARALFGIDPPESGEACLEGKELDLRAVSRDVALVPEDRRHEGLHLSLPIRENTTLAVLPRLARWGWIRSREVSDQSRKVIDRLGVKTSDDRLPVSTLSGGNQQKVLIGKWLATQPRVLILDEPTRGVDVGSKAEIHRLVRQLADEGDAVLLISSELPEVLALADRVLVMRQGQIAGELTGPALTQEAVMALALPQQVDPMSRPGRVQRRIPREAFVAALLVLLLALVGVVNPSFLSLANARDVLVKVAPIAIVSCGMTWVILAREIDVSVGSTMGLAAAMLGLAGSSDRWGLAPPVAATIALGTATLVGLVNGVLIAKARISSIIVTLGTMTLVQGITEVAMGGRWIENMPTALRGLGTGGWCGVPWAVIAAVIVVLVSAWVVKRTPFGKRLVALGSNPHAAESLGVPTDRVRIAIFAGTGLLAGVATLFSATQLQVIESGFGRGMEMTAIAAVVVGGTSIRGGRGTILGTTIGVLLLGILGTALIFLRLGPSAVYWERAIQGAVILAAVLAEALGRRRNR